MTPQIHFPFRTSKGMMNNEQPVLDIVPNTAALLFIEKPNHLGRISDYGINIVPFDLTFIIGIKRKYGSKSKIRKNIITSCY
jgi:hypothetical protein